MKKIGLIIVALIILSLAVIQTSAAEAVCSADVYTVSAGDKIVVTVTLKDCVNVKTMGITPVYDKKAFELVSAKWVAKGSLIDDFDEKNGNGVILFASSKNCNGEIFRFELKANDGIAPAQYKLSARLIIKDGNNKDVECSSPENTVTVEGGVQTVVPGETVAVTDAVQSSEVNPETKPVPEDSQAAADSQHPEESLTVLPESNVSEEQTSLSETSEGNDVAYTDEYTGEKVPYEPEQEELLNNNTVLWVVIAVVGCVAAGVCLASFKKRK